VYPEEEMNPAWRQAVEEQGFAVVPNVLLQAEITGLIKQFADPTLHRSRAGIRHALGLEAVATLARNNRLLGMARAILGDGAIPFHATVFEKSPVSNWLVVWHQDTALPLRERQDRQGWGPWSVKDGVTYAHAPANALSHVLALRVHLDDSTLENGPLRVLPGTHKLGVLSDDEIQAIAQKTAAVDSIVARGGVLAMRPLIVHASSKLSVGNPRRVLHIEYASSLFIQEGMELAIA
jgi:ectoine hydroxylase-related dioxygenase (phytanoyl-CoA dioxygenase family)